MEVFGKSNRTQRYCPYLEGIHNSDNILLYIGIVIAYQSVMFRPPFLGGFMSAKHSKGSVEVR